VPHSFRWFFGYLLILCSGCGLGADQSTKSPPAPLTAGAPAAPPPAEAAPAEPEAPAAASAAAATTVAASDHPGLLLTYQANLALAVYEVDKGLDAVEKLTRDAGGYLVSRSGNAIVVRVPASHFDGSLKQVLALGDVLERELHVEDVTAKVRDLEVRLQNAQAVRKRLVELLAGASKTVDALAVERELARVTEDVERMKADLKRFSELVAYSTLTVRFEAPHAEALDRRFKLPFPWLQELGLSRLLSL
jgi:hypothetical protein